MKQLFKVMFKFSNEWLRFRRCRNFYESKDSFWDWWKFDGECMGNMWSRKKLNGCEWTKNLSVLDEKSIKNSLLQSKKFKKADNARVGTKLNE